MSSRDIIRWVIDRMLAHDDSITQELALTVEREARAQWGGQRIDYIPKTMDRRRPNKLAPEDEGRAYRAALDTDKPMTALEQEYGVSRATMYRLIKRGPRSS